MAGKDLRVSAPTRWRRSALGVATLVVAALAAACDEKAVESWLREGEPRRESLYGEGELKRALDTLSRQLPKHTEALSLTVEAERLVVQYRNSQQPDTVDQRIYAHGTVGKAIQVKLMGKGALDDNLFPLDSARVSSVPTLVQAAKQKLSMQDGRVTRVVLKRNLPESMDIQFKVFLSLGSRAEQVVADKDGNIVE